MIFKSIKFLSLIFSFSLIALLLTGGFSTSAPPADAQAAGNPRLCFTILDGQNSLHYKDRFTGAETTVGNVGVLNIEALEMSLDNSFLYAVDDPAPAVHTDEGQFGYLDDYLTAGGGDFTLIGAIPAAHNVLLGTQNLDDVDSLSFDARTNKLWGITQDPGNNVIFQINPTNGDHVSDNFGVGYDYAVVDLGVDTAAQTVRACGGGVINCGTECPDTIDDLGIDPTDGTFYAVGNAISGLGVDYIMRIEVDGVDPSNSPGFDPAQGDVEACAIGVLELEDTPGNFVTVNDMEGFGVHNDGTFYGATGTETISPSPSGVVLNNSMYRIDPTTATVFYLDPANPGAGNWNGSDAEALTCLTAGSNLITGTVYEDADPTDNELYKPGAGDVSQEDVTVELYLDNDGNGSVNAGDTLLQTQQTAVNPNDPTNDGFYSFEVGITGNFAVRILPGTLPTGANMTTDNREEADFPDWGNLDPDNDYGFNFATGFDLGISKDDGVTTYVPGGTLTYNIIVTNFGPADAVGATVTDTFPPQFTSVSWTCTPSAGATCTAGPVQGNINDTVDIPANGVLTYTATVQIDPNATCDIIANIAEVDHPGDSDPTNNRDDDTDTPSGSCVTVTPPPPVTVTPPIYDLAITKQVDPPSALPGDVVTWTITVTNTGNAPLTGVTVTDPVDPAFFSEIISTTTTKGTVFIAGLNVTFNIGDLAVGETVTMTIVTRIRDGVTSGTGVNTATGTANEIPGIRQASASVTVGVTLLPATGYPPGAVEPEAGPRYWLYGMLGVLIVGAAGLLIWRKR